MFLRKAGGREETGQRRDHGRRKGHSQVPADDSEGLMKAEAEASLRPNSLREG